MESLSQNVTSRKEIIYRVIKVVGNNYYMCLSVSMVLLYYYYFLVIYKDIIAWSVY